MNYYIILGVSRTADRETIRSAFRALARRYHPDAGTGSCARKFRDVVEAYETLIDPVARNRYDRTLALREMQSNPWRVPVRFGAPEPPARHMRVPHAVRFTPEAASLDDLIAVFLRSFDDFFDRF
jgi:DnaJ-class molecular chaperone